MKRGLMLVFLVSLLRVGPAEADPDRTVVGAVLGTAAGLIVANNVHGVNPWVAAPVGAVLGGYIGAQYDRHEDWAWSHRERGYRHGDYRHGYPYARGYAYAEPAPAVVYVQEKAPPKPEPVAQPADPHPGVDLIKISILNSNGIRTDIPILRVKDRFIGPQGETYETLPSSEMLAKKYGM